ncbi:MAG TPA: desulfoferrodoxin family protein [Victivallales bacterium]|nr:desulfoferrodoxin family protein [Victivallales bacterium]
MKLKRGDVLKCHKNMTIEMLSDADCEITCCGEPVVLQKENTVDASKEKHVPVLKEGQKGTKVEVGAVPHPMTEEHHIEWIEIINRDYVNRKYLKPGESPSAEFYVPKSDKLIVRAYCNLHGLWRA